MLIATGISLLLGACGQDPMMSGIQLLEKKEYASAVIEFKNAIESAPESLAARLALAEALERSYDSLGAEEQLRKVALSGGDADTLLPRIAQLMLDRNDIAKVINEFKDQHLKSPEADSNLRAAVAMAYIEQKKLTLAQEQLQAASTNSAAVMLAKAQLLLAQGKAVQAIEVLDSSLAEPNAPWWVLRGLSRIYEANGQHEQAFKFMTRTYEAAPWHRGVMGGYGEFLVGVGALDKAVLIRDRLKQQAPNFYFTHYVDALVLAAQGHSEASFAAAIKVLAVAPEHLPATLLVASAEMQKGDVMMASTRLKKMAPQYPYSLPLLQLLSEVQLRVGKPDEADDLIRRGLNVAPANARLLSLRAESEVMHGKTKDATATLQ